MKKIIIVVLIIVFIAAVISVYLLVMKDKNVNKSDEKQLLEEQAADGRGGLTKEQEDALRATEGRGGATQNTTLR